MHQLNLKIITPKRIALEEKVLSVTAPADEGEITILPRHVPLFTLLKEGIVKVKRENGEDYLAIGGGYLQTDGNEVNLIVSRAYKQNEIDQRLIEQSIQEAKKIISQTKDKGQRTEAMAILRRSIINLKLLKKRRRQV